MQHEKGHGKLLVPDQLLCEWIDGNVVPRYSRTNFAQLDQRQREKTAGAEYPFTSAFIPAMID